MDETVRLVVDAVSAYSVPLTPSAVVDAYVSERTDGSESVMSPVEPEAATWFAVPAMEVTPVLVTAPAEYVRPVENVVVALSNFEKYALVRQPKTEADAVSQVTLPLAYVTPVEKVVVALGTHVPAVVYVRTFPAVPAAKSEEVESAVGVAALPVTFARTELAAMFASARVALLPPIW